MSVHIINLKMADPSEIPMTQDHKDKLIKNHDYIVQKLEREDQVVEYLLAKNCIDEDSAQQILSKTTPRDRTRNILHVLSRSTDSAFQYFIEALYDTQDSPVLTNVLRDESSSQDKKTPFLYGAAQVYYNKLRTFHQHNLGRLSTKLGRHDPDKYISLTLQTQEPHQLAAERKGFRENMMTKKSSGQPILPENIFQPDEEGREAPRTVLLLSFL